MPEDGASCAAERPVPRISTTGGRPMSDGRTGGEGRAGDGTGGGGGPDDGGGFRQRLARLVESDGFSNAIFAVIVLNVIALILSSSETLTEEFGAGLFIAIHKLSLVIFALEM